MRIAVQAYPGVPRVCYQQLINAARALSRKPRMQTMARWGWGQFSTWLHALPFEMDTGCKDEQCANGCTPPQRMREFPPTMNCWERVLHQLAWFWARGAERVTVYDHDTLVGRHIEVLVPPTTNLSAAANSIEDQAKAGAISGALGALNGGIAGSIAGPYGALAGLILGAAAGVAKSVMAGEGKDSPKPAAPPAAQPPQTKEVTPTAPTQPAKEVAPTAATQPAKGIQRTRDAPPNSFETLIPSIQTLLKRNLQRPHKAKSTKKKRKKS